MQKPNAKSAFIRVGRNLVCTGLVLQGFILAPTLLIAADRPKPIDSLKWRTEGQSGDSGISLIQFTDDGNGSNSISSAFKKAGSTISGFFKTEPHEPVDQEDPIRLSNMPDEIGANVYLSAARMMENAGNFEGAERQYTICLEKFSTNRLAQISYARLLHRNQRLREALAIYEKAEKDHPKDATIQNDMGLCLARLGNKDDAMHHFHQATVIAPEDPRYRNNLAMVLVDAGRADEALSQLVFAHGEAKGHYNLGYLLYRKGNKSMAAAHFQAALQKDPSLKAAGEMLARIQASEEAASIAQDASPARPNTMFISDQPKDELRPTTSSKVPPAPGVEPPRLLPPIN